MNSEKVKEIKKALEYCYRGCDGECYRNNDNGEDYYDCRDGLLLVALELINELESENERLMKLQARGGCRVAELGIENQQLKDQIAEIEKEIKENPSYAKGYADGIKNTYEAMLPQKLENFIKRLKEKDLSVPLHKDFMIIDNKAIDETLKEFGL